MYQNSRKRTTGKKSFKKKSIQKFRWWWGFFKNRPFVVRIIHHILYIIRGKKTPKTTLSISVKNKRKQRY